MELTRTQPLGFFHKKSVPNLFRKDQEKHETEFAIDDCPNFNSLECLAMISNTTLLGDTIAATLASLPRLPPLLLPSWLTIPPWLGWLSSCCITRLFKDGGDQEICEYRKCRVGIGGWGWEGTILQKAAVLANVKAHCASTSSKEFGNLTMSEFFSFLCQKGAMVG